MDAEQHIKSITVLKQIIRADGTREPVQLAAYVDRDPDEMERVIRENDVQGRCTSGQLVTDLLNDVSPEAARRITELNERKDPGVRVALQHTDPEHPNGEVAAYRFGRVQDFEHPVSGERLSADQLMVALLDQARQEYPESDGYRVWAERLSDPDESGESRWEAIDEEALRARAGGEPVDVPLVSELSLPQVQVAAEQEQTASGEEH